MNKIKYIKTQDEQGEISENLFISADAVNIDLQDGTNVQTKVNNIDNILNTQSVQITDLANTIAAMNYEEQITAIQNNLTSLQNFIDNIDFNTFEQNTNKVISIDENSNDNEYPTAKCLYNLLGGVEEALDLLIGEEVE